MDDTKRRQIDLTADEVLQANIEALGMVEQPTGKSEVVLAAYLRWIKERKTLPTAVDIASFSGVCISTVRYACSALVENGKMLRYRNKATGQHAYIPRVV